MVHPKDASRRKMRRSIYHTLILIALAIAAGRIAVVTSKQGDTAFLSANDRSRWCTVASLVEHGTYAIDSQVAITDEVNQRRHPWDTIDKVRHLGSDGKQHYYSSKPPLFPTMVAGVYKLVAACTGMVLTDQPIYLTRIILALVNLPLFAVFLFCTIYSIDRLCSGDWARRLAVMSTCFATMLLPFCVSLNNHLPAASATALAMWIYIWAAERTDESYDSSGSDKVAFGWWALAGVAAAFAAANELPALSMAALWFVLFAWLSRASIIPFLLGASVVVAGFFVTNLIAHDSLRPPYAHRGNGDLITRFVYADSELGPELNAIVQRELVKFQLVADEMPIEMRSSDEEGRWVVTAGEQQFAMLRTATQWQLAHWDDWYEYPGTYWKEGGRKGVDLGEPSRLTYFLHMTIGHHGLFSITPIWLLVPFGMLASMRIGPYDLRRLALAIFLSSAVCVAFYLARPLVDRNYGGVSVCFRWLLWFAPLWIVASVPAFEKCEKSLAGRNLLRGMLVFSVLSVSMALVNPWQSPWIYQFWQFLGWISP